MSTDPEPQFAKSEPGSVDPAPLAYAAATAEHIPAGMKERLVRVDSFTNRLITLHEISLQVDAEHTRDEILNVLQTQVKWIIPHDVAFVCLLDRFRTHYRLTALTLPPGISTLDGDILTVNEGTPGVVMQTHSPMVVDLGSDPFPPYSIEDKVHGLGMRAFLVVPLQGGDETIGALAFASRLQNAYGVQDLAIARLLASQIAVALLNTSLFDDAKRRIVQIELVNELAQKLTSTLELEELLCSATETIQKTFKYTDVTIFLLDGSGQVARMVAHTGSSSVLVPLQYTQKLSEGIIGWVATHGERVLANDVSQEPLYINPSKLKTKAELAIPVRVKGKVVGVLNVEDERAHVFDETDVIVLETLCDQIGSALHNAQLYDELRRTNAKLTELDRMKSDFLSIVSHDFRSPLSSIMLAARSILKKDAGDISDRGNKYLQVIIDQANKLITLAEDTLSITRLESGKLSYMFNVVNIERLVLDAAAQVSFTSQHRLRLDLEKGVSYVRGDQAKLRQVFQNLLSNAVKYSPAGGLVEVCAKTHSSDQLVLSVRDEGIGIPNEQMDRLFQKFSRIDTDEARRIRGTGLGLWICREIVKAHGGEIWVDSVPGKGSAFNFTLRKASADIQSGS
jgi:signal transduction histidine kinase